MKLKVPYGEKHKHFELPEKNVVIKEPGKGSPIENLNEKFEKLCLKPTGAPPLSNQINLNSNIAIVVDDDTRPTPTYLLLPELLEFLEREGAKKENIMIIIALGAHRPLDKKEKEKLLGKKIVDNYKVVNHQPKSQDKLVNLGKTSFGTPVHLNRDVYRADLRILTGLIKPHNQAGFSGGGKSLLPGVCGLKTIASNHSFASISHTNSQIGMVKDNPIRSDIEETLEKIGPTYIFNFVMDHKKTIFDLVGGEAIKAHREGVKKVRKKLAIEVEENQYELTICGTPAPISKNFYQMLNSLSVPYRGEVELLNEHGSIIVLGPAPEGISDGDFLEVMSKYSSDSLWQKVKNETESIQDRPALQIFLEGARQYDIIVVSEPKNIHKFGNMGIKAYSSLNQAIKENFNDIPKTLVLPYAPYSVPVKSKNYS